MSTSSSIRPHLLSVEDNPDTRVLLKHLLDGNYELTFATGFDEALDAIGSDESFDLLLVDINLGSENSGTELLHEINRRDDLGEIPAIAVTAYAMPGDREDLLAEGFDEYVGKPFTGDELNETIENVLSAS